MKDKKTNKNVNKPLIFSGIFVSFCSLLLIVIYIYLINNETFAPIYIIILAIILLPLGVSLLFFNQIKAKITKKQSKNTIENKEAIAKSNEKCPFCGETLVIKNNFCSACGKNVAPIICNKCGTENPCTNTYCNHCKNRLI